MTAPAQSVLENKPKVDDLIADLKKFKYRNYRDLSAHAFGIKEVDIKPKNASAVRSKKHFRSFNSVD
jgi:hypothetical protein